MDKMTKPNETPSTDSAWIESLESEIEKYITKDRMVKTFQESEELGFRDGANFGYNYRGQIEAKRVEGLIAALEFYSKPDDGNGKPNLAFKALTQFRNGAVNG